MKRYFLLFAVCLLLVLTLPALAQVQADRWALPSSDCSLSQIPRLSQPLVIDGNINEWQGAACVQMLSRIHVTILDRNHKWLGPDDAGMEVYCAWNDQGLCLAAVVADNDVRNNRKNGEDWWQQDCVEFFLDGRATGSFMQYPYSKGAFQLLVRPPVDEDGVLIVPNKRDGEIRGLQTAGKLTDSGFTIELLIPWSNFPDLTPRAGADIAIQFALDEYDARAGNVEQSLQITWNGVRHPWCLPQVLIKSELVDKLPAGPNASLGSLAYIDMPVSADNKTTPITVHMARDLALQVKFVQFDITDSNSVSVFTSTILASPRPAPWQHASYAFVKWPAAPSIEGYHTVTARFIGKDGKILGSVRKPILCSGATVNRLMSRLERVDLGKLAQSDPFKAANYLGAGACIEKLKYHIEQRNNNEIVFFARETEARLALLDSGKLVEPQSSILDLLNLTANPDAQVVVEYPAPSRAVVMLYCGSVPMVTADIQQFDNATDARNSALNETDETKPPVLERFERVTVAGCPGRTISELFQWQEFEIEDYSADTHVMVLVRPWGRLFVFPADMLADLDADAITILESAPGSVKQSVEKWAEGRSLPSVSLAEAQEDQRILIAGDINAPELAEIVDRYRCATFNVIRNFRGFYLACGNRTIKVNTPVREVADKVAEMIVAGKPITAVDNDAVRSALVSALAPADASPAKPDTGMFCGDVHMHTFYSDGRPSPTGLMLQAMHCFMDYAVITDHNTIEGAVFGQKLLTENGFTFPCIVGEEVTTNWVHFNAYPLTQVVKPGPSLFEMVKAAHAQGAVTQWNHPGFPGGEWDRSQQKKILHDTAFSAWEHIPAKYDEWKTAGVCPIVVGSTDTHNGTFGFPERTVVFAPDAGGRNVAEAVRSGHVAAVALMQPHFAYGPDKYTDYLWAALADGKELKAGKADRLRKHLKNADLVTLIKSSPSAPRE